MKRITLIAGAVMIAVASTSVVATAKGGPGGGQGHGIERLFERLDTDQDGTITKAEVEAAGAARFTEADTNGDGLLSAEEMAAAAEGKRAKRIERRVEKRIERHDANGDGMLSLEEITADGGNRIERLFEHMDADGDGVITKAEAEAAKPLRRGHGRGHGKSEDN